MPKSRRVNARDVNLAGSLEALIRNLVDELVKGNMEAKEHGAMLLRSHEAANAHAAKARSCRPRMAAPIASCCQPVFS